MMAWSLSNLAFSLLLLAPSSAVANILPRQTTFGNSTVVSSTSTKPPSSGTTPPPCCWIAAGGTALGLHKWYSSTVDHVVATVITTYIRENNGSAIPANSTTIYVTQNSTTFPDYGDYPYVLNPSWPMVSIPGVPATLIDPDQGWSGGDYCATVVDNSTAVSFTYTDLVIAQPTPFDEWFFIGIYTQTPNASDTLPTGLTAWPRESCGTWAYDIYTDYATTEVTDGGSTVTSYIPGDVETKSSHVPSGKSPYFLATGHLQGSGIQDLSVKYVQPKTSQVPDGMPWLPIPTGLRDWLGTQESIVEEYPYITDCWLDQGNGQPSVHVPVNQLTVTSSHIIDVQKAPTTTAAPKPHTEETETPLTPSITFPTITEPQSSPATAKTEISLIVPTAVPTDTEVHSSPATAKTEISLVVPTAVPTTPKTAQTQKTETSLDVPTFPPTDTEVHNSPVTQKTEITLVIPTIVPADTKKTSAPKAVTARPEETLVVPEGSPVSRGSAVVVQTTKADNNDDEPGNGQTVGKEDTPGSQGQNTAQQTAGGVGGLISAIQSVATQQAGVSQTPEDNQNDTPNRPVAVITTNKPTASVTGFVIGSQTASPGGAPVTRGGSIFSALPSGSGLQVVANGETSTLVDAAPPKITVAQSSGSDGGYVVGESTLVAGGAAITSGESIFSALPSGSGVQVIANGKTEVVPASSPAGFQIAQAADSEIGYVVGDKTLTAGGAAATSGGATFSALPSGGGVVVISDGQTSTVPATLPAGSQSNVQPGRSGGEYVFAGNSLTAGGQAITSNGATYSALPSNGGVQVISNGQTSTLPVSSPSVTGSVQSGRKEGEYAFAGTTLTAGGQAITSNGATYSALRSNGGVVVVSNGQTSTIPVSSPSVTESVQSGRSENEYVFAGTTLSAGGAALTSAGTTFSALPSGSGLAIIADGATRTASLGETIGTSDSSLPTPVLLPADSEQLITVGDKTYTARITDGSLLVLGSQTVKPGVTTVINGETLLLTGSNLVLATGTSTSTRGLGDAIISGIGGGSSDSESGGSVGESTDSASAAEPTSGAGRMTLGDVRVLVCGLGLVMFAFAWA